MSTADAIIEQLPSTAGVGVVDNPVSTDVAQLDRHGYLFGRKIAGSLSPLLHNTIYEKMGLNWGQVRFDSSDIKTFLGLIQNPRFYGASVTMPNKVAILPYLDEITPECQDVGACNTIYVRERNGRRLFCGTNTDVIGIRESFYQNVSDPDAVFHHKPALVVGSGGAARSAVYTLRKWMKVKDIYLVNRDVSEVESLMADCTSRGYGDGLIHVSSAIQAKDLESPGAIVSCVPDFEPSNHEEKQARLIIEEFLKKARKGAMLEMCYNPTPFTRLGAIAQKEGWQVILGTEALIWQGLEQDRYWTEREVTDLPVDTAKEVISKNVSERAASSRL